MIDTGKKKRCFEYYCDNIENVENYEAAKKDNFKGWNCHHRLETHNSDGERRLVDISHKELIALDMYYNRPASELIFLTPAEHKRLHRKGKKMPAISEALKGKHHSEETRKRMSEAHKGMHNEACKGKHWKLVDGKRVWY